MPHCSLPVSRREAVRGALALGAAALWAPGALAEMLAPTPRMTEGPFYPDHLPLDTDNDLLILNDALTPAVGEVTHLSGRVLSAAGEPVRGAVVEIWQVDHNGVYLHSQDRRSDQRDKNFQGYGRFLTDASGAYYFRTIKPVAYPGRTPHIHVAVSRNGRRVLTTQLFVSGEPQNERDGVLGSLRDEAERRLLMVDFRPLEGSTIGELAAEFPLVLGVTPAEGDDGRVRSRRRG